MEIDLSDKVVIITGGSKGIGRGLVKAFAEHGCYVYFTFLDSKENAVSLEKELCDRELNVTAKKVDSCSMLEVKNFVDEVGKKHGVIDIVINNAGYIPRGLFMATSEETWKKAMNTNINGTYYFCHSVLKYMILNKGGSIVNISSVSALQPNRGQAAYGASKAAIESMTRTLAIEYGKYNIRINTIAPGIIETDGIKTISKKVQEDILKNTPLNRYGQIEDIVNAAIFLTSNKASHITGIQLLITGGRHLV